MTSDEGGTQTWQYAMPEQALDTAACPRGHGSGTYNVAANVQAIVAVVGTAHVYGIMQHLEALQTRKH